MRIKVAKEHLAETGMTWWEHKKHVWFMVWCALRAIWYSIPHAFHPGIYPGTARDIMFGEALKEQLRSRPDLLEKGK